MEENYGKGKGKLYKVMVNPAMLYGNVRYPAHLSPINGQEKKMEVAESETSSWNM